MLVMIPCNILIKHCYFLCWVQDVLQFNTSVHGILYVSHLTKRQDGLNIFYHVTININIGLIVISNLCFILSPSWRLVRWLTYNIPWTLVLNWRTNHVLWFGWNYDFFLYSNHGGRYNACYDSLQYPD
jgi:hypothetical protein